MSDDAIRLTEIAAVVLYGLAALMIAVAVPFIAWGLYVYG
jgi:hypothetical protein